MAVQLANVRALLEAAVREHTELMAREIAWLQFPIVLQRQAKQLRDELEQENAVKISQAGPHDGGGRA